MSVSTCLNECLGTVCMHPQRARRYQISWDEITDDCELSHRCWEFNRSPQEEQPLLPTESSL